MRYCLDSNVYIEAHRRYYAFDIAPGFWDSLRRLAEEEIICSPILVFEEISDSGNELARWAKANKDVLFVQPDDTTQEAYKEIADMAARLYEPQHVQKFLSGADPWVIAHAKVDGLMVVTLEALKNEQINAGGIISGKIQIPNMCKLFKVGFRDTFGLLREQKIVLR